jgi:hypothetical protein
MKKAPRGASTPRGTTLGKERSMAIMTETWKPVFEFPDHYEVSSLGSVKRTRMTSGVTNFGEPLKPAIINSGYKSVGLSVDGKKRHRLVHRLVTEAFIGPIPPGMFVNHKDGDKFNNAVDNLEILTPSESSHHAVSLGLHLSGERHFNSKLTDDDANAILALRYKESSTAIAARFGVTSGTITRIWRRGQRRGEVTRRG